MKRHIEGLRMPDRRTLVLAGAAAIAALGLGMAAPALAADQVELAISIKDHKKDHKFDPAEVKVPAGKATAVVRLKPLKKGSYTFFATRRTASPVREARS